MPTTIDQSETQTATQPIRSDEELMEAILAREQAALDALYARYRPLISKIVMESCPTRRRRRSPPGRVHGNLEPAANFDMQKGKPLGWIICMARRRAIDHYRKIRRRAEANEKLRLNGEGESGMVANGQPIVATVHEDLAGATDLRKFLTR